jgi:uncharacterized protein YndB with AHSA1/START domain
MTVANRDSGTDATPAEPNPSKLKITLPSDLEIVLTRVFDAPRRLLWEAVTKPEHVKQWWGCYGMTLSVCEIDFRVGGAWRFVFRKPDGTDDTFKGEYLEIVSPEKVVQTFIYDVDFIRDYPSIETMTLNETSGKTTLQVVIRHKTKEARDGHLNSGMEGGATQTYDRLAEFLTTMS